MKKLILTLTIATFSALALNANAQDSAKPDRGGRGAGPRISPEERLKHMTETLGLNQEQQDKIKAIFEENRSKFAELRDLPEEERRQKGRDLMQAQMGKIREVLTPDQQEKWKTEMEKRRGEGGRRGEGRQKGESK